MIKAIETHTHTLKLLATHAAKFCIECGNRFSYDEIAKFPERFKEGKKVIIIDDEKHTYLTKCGHWEPFDEAMLVTDDMKAYYITTAEYMAGL
jgi:hypothetical protein